VSTPAALALARTVQLLVDDVFGRRLGEDPVLEAAIVQGLQSTTVRLRADRANLGSPDGQTAFVALFGLLAMMGIGIDLDIPQVDILASQPPLQEGELGHALLAYGADLIPGARIGTDIGAADLTFVLGDTPTPDATALRLTGDAWRCQIRRANPSTSRRWRGSWPFGALAGAGAAAAEGLRAALPRISTIADLPLPPNPRFHLDLGRSINLDLSAPGLQAHHMQLGNVDFVSGGAITTAALYCLARVPRVSGQLRVIEPDRLDLSNLNRYPLARRSDCDRFKVDILTKIQTRRLTVLGVHERFDPESAARIGPLSQRVLVGVDDIPSRWAVQRAANGWVGVAATSHFYGLMTTHQPGHPCAGCAHPRDDDLDGPIPTISFVSFWAGLIQARALLIDTAGTPSAGAALHISPFGLYGPRGLQPGGVPPRADCPVDCAASRTAA
jgi:molybdopterin/thiamine biosynthesis adenylyltransferase